MADLQGVQVHCLNVFWQHKVVFNDQDVSELLKIYRLIHAGVLFVTEGGFGE